MFAALTAGQPDGHAMAAESKNQHGDSHQMAQFNEVPRFSVPHLHLTRAITGVQQAAQKAGDLFPERILA